MKRLSVFILTVVCVFICASGAFAWTDDVEGMLMPSPRGEDNMSDPEAILENIEPSEDESSERTAPTIEWE
jgi:hypothetical protein